MFSSFPFVPVLAFLFLNSCSLTDFSRQPDRTITDSHTVSASTAIGDASFPGGEDSSFTYTRLYVIDSLYLPTGYPEDLRTGFNATVTAIQPTSGSATFQKMVADSLHQLLEMPLGGPANETSFHRYLQVRKQTYRKEMEPLIGSDDVDFGDFKFREEVTMRVAFNRAQVFTLSTDIYQYRGGAYGDFSTHLKSFSENPARAIGLRDLFSDGTDKALGKMIAASIEGRRLYDPDGDFPVTNNFGLTAEGIVFAYPSYDVPVVGSGQLVVTVPLDTLLQSSLLTAAGRKFLRSLR
ncbi:DUF3298 and DUF4163 domain-containing protein [Neolewinella agarilytica]|uniref:DUF3298 domain-containing protein n=1 Tax=Neolewinella agarilytica TaxID=478744 RepID=A0A1H8Z8L5_9BACT|nr:DUF3298 and DUF4163 domain-containing protein [Neolewinella agarilytica]SEP60770.1 Protein of unknown function [Neolewinella agarilytica]